MSDQEKDRSPLFLMVKGDLFDAHAEELKAAREMREQMAVLRIHGIRFGKTAVGHAINAYDAARAKSEELEK